MKTNPLITVITVVYNGEKYLEETILSVINQSYENIEYIIIDGGSTDGTLDIIKKYEDKIAYWVSEKDNGIYDAMNKGIKQSKGDLIGMINADDYYEKDTLLFVADAFAREEKDVFYGDIFYLDGVERSLVPAHDTGLKYGIFPYSFKWIWVNMLFGHPTTFVKKTIYDEIGLFDTSYRISGDYDFFFKLVKAQKQFYYIKEPLVTFRLGGVSDTANKIKERENENIRKKNGLIIGAMINTLYKVKKLFEGQ